MNDNAHNKTRHFLGKETYQFLMSVCETCSDHELQRYFVQITNKMAEVNISPSDYAIYLAYSKILEEEIELRKLSK